MKILQITSSFLPVVGGTEKVVYEISKELVKRGHEVTILTSDFLCKEKVKHKETIDGIKVIRFKNKYYLGGYGYCPDAIKWLKRNYKNYDVVHSHGYNRYLSEFGVFYLYGKIPVVFSPCGFTHTKKNIFMKMIHDWLIGWRVGKADVCTTLTKLDLRSYDKLGVSRKKIAELPGGVEIDKYNRIDAKRMKLLREKYGLNKNILLYVGRIHKSKGLQYVVKAIKDLDCKLFIVGPDGGFRSELVKQIKEEGIMEKVVFSGAISDEELIAVYHLSDIFVLFSEWEGFGLVVIEAMAAGKPVIVSDRGSLPFLVNNGNNGLVVPFPSIEDLKNNISKLITNDKLRLRLARKSKKFSKNFSWESVVRQTEEIYKRASKDEK